MFPAAVIIATLPLLALFAQDQHSKHEAQAVHDTTVYETSGIGKPARIPFQFLGNEVRVDVTVNGSGPYHIILDTGMPVPGILLFQSTSVDALHLDGNGQHVQVAGAGGDGTTSEALMASGLSLALGELKMSNASALVLAKPPGFPPGVDGVIGGALFFHYVVRVDMEQNRLELYEPAEWTPPAGACIVPLERDAGRVFVDVRVAVGAGEPVKAHVVVDIGAAHALSLNAREDGRFSPPAGAIEASLGRGVSGVVLGQVGRARRVEIGTFAFENVVTSFPVGKHQHPGGEDFHDGNLGQEILKRFDVTFDYAGKRMVLEKAKGFGEPFEREMAGLSLDWEKDGSITVGLVLPRSPAATAGIQPGDRLLSIDDRSVESLAENGLRKALTADGVEVRLSLKRGGEVLEKRIRLRRLV